MPGDVDSVDDYSSTPASFNICALPAISLNDASDIVGLLILSNGVISGWVLTPLTNGYSLVEFVK